MAGMPTARRSTSASQAAVPRILERVAEIDGQIDAQMRGHRERLTAEDLRSQAAGFRIVIPNAETAGYSYASTGIGCSHTVDRYTVEYGEVYQDDFFTLKEAQAYVAGRLSVARDSLRWVPVQDGRGYSGMGL